MNSARQKSRSKKQVEKKKFNTSKIFTYVYIFVLIITFFKIYPTIFDEKIDLNGDNVQYYLLGTSIAQGDGFSDIRMPEKPASNRFPPGYPFIVSVVIKVFSGDIHAVKYANGIFLLCSILLLFLLFKKIIKNIHLSFVISILLLLNAHLLRSSTIMMSEISYLLFSVIALYALMQIKYETPIYKNSAFYVMVVSVAVAYLTRSSGLALVGGILLVFVFEKKWKYAAGFLGGFILLNLPWYFRSKFSNAGSTGGYMDLLMYKNPYQKELGTMEIKDWFTRLFHNTERYITHEIPNGCFSFIDVKYNDPTLTKEWITGILIIAIAIFGLIKLERYRNILLFYLLGNFGIMLLWPEVWFGTRFLLPVIPIILMLSIFGAYTVITYFLSKLKIKSSAVINTILPFGFLILAASFKPGLKTLNENAKRDYPPNYKNYFELGLWANQNISDTSIVACRKPGLFYLFSRRYSTGYPQIADVEALIEGMQNRKVDYVVLEELGYSSTARYLYPAIKKYPSKFKAIKRMGESNTYLFEFHPELGYWGEWNNNKREGTGSFTWENGVHYEGNWKNGQREGKGKLTVQNGDVYEGVWMNDKMEGEFTIKSANGNSIEKALYQDNRKIKTLTD